MLIPSQIPAIHDQFTADWHKDPATASPGSGELMTFVVEQHRQNFALWHEEDRDSLAAESRGQEAVKKSFWVQSRLEDWLVTRFGKDLSVRYCVSA